MSKEDTYYKNNRERIEHYCEEIGVEPTSKMKIVKKEHSYKIVEGGHGHYRKSTNSGGDKFIRWI
jgi:hypothetical protein